jgi:hypothetical protein
MPWGYLGYATTDYCAMLDSSCWQRYVLKQTRDKSGSECQNKYLETGGALTLEVFQTDVKGRNVESSKWGGGVTALQ